MFGVFISPPKQPMSEKPMSSHIIKMRLGRGPTGGVLRVCLFSLAVVAAVTQRNAVADKMVACLNMVPEAPPHAYAADRAAMATHVPAARKAATLFPHFFVSAVLLPLMMASSCFASRFTV